MSEKVKKALLTGMHAGIVFFDFTDAFGSVNRQKLLLKIRRDFSISGRMLMHLQAFLTDRTARLKMEGKLGEWMPSDLGTSAGTILGPILFILYVHDTPPEITPKFADDLNTIVVSGNPTEIEESLQARCNSVAEWSKKWKMKLNAGKIKVMCFTESPHIPIILNIDGIPVKQVSEFKYLGVMLDQKLEFNLHVEYAVGKASRAFGKMAYLMDGREGLDVKTGIQLYKALVRPHLEYAVPVWSALKEVDVQKLEKCQLLCLRRIIGSKQHSSGNATEVIANVVPFRIRMQELCCREMVRILTKPENHILQILLQQSIKVKNKFCPLAFIKLKSKVAINKLGTNKVAKEYLLAPDDILNKAVINQVELFEKHVGSSRNRTAEQKKIAKTTLEDFIAQNKGVSLMIFTDGSVYKGAVGFGACSAILIPHSEDGVRKTESEGVGSRVDNVECEIAGIALAVRMAYSYFQQFQQRKLTEKVFICTDCQSAIEVIRNQNDISRRPEVIRGINDNAALLKSAEVEVYLVWCPGHADIEFNELADLEAKSMAARVASRGVSDADEVSMHAAFRIISEEMKSVWQRKWDTSLTGRQTHGLITKVGTKILLPKRRDVAISYVRLLLFDTLLNEDQHRIGLQDSPNCVCGLGRESDEHFLLYCPNHHLDRMALTESVREMWMSKKKHGNLSLSKGLLIGPRWDDRLSAEEDDEIKRALFSFIANTGRKL